MRDINNIIIHCSYTKKSQDIGAAEIRAWHTDPKPKGNGWRDIGYHYVIRRNGAVENGRDEAMQGSHVAGHNTDSIGICLVGGMNDAGIADSNFTFLQFKALHKLVGTMKKRYASAAIIGHRDIKGSGKSCPVFDAAAFFATGDET